MSLVMVIIACAFVGANAQLRAKRQLSPAVRLETDLRPLLVGMYGYAPEPLNLKRSSPQLKRHISPSFDVEEDMGNMRALLDVGKRSSPVLGQQKRHLSPAADVEEDMGNMRTLFGVGKRAVPAEQHKRHLSPAFDVEEDMGNIRNLLGVGKRSAPADQHKRHLSPSFDVEEDMGNMRALLDVGKRSHVSVANDLGGQMQMYNRLFDAGKKRSVVSPAHELESSLAFSDFLERAGR